MLVILSMKLAEWLKRTKTRRYQFAERIGVRASVVSDYCKGRYCPRPKVAEAIIRETGGEVTANDFLSIAPDEAPGEQTQEQEPAE
jgi:DNA-binding transcriptional regulator YdaS (Cro superfamily)